MAEEPIGVEAPQADTGAPAAPQSIDDFMSSRNRPAGQEPKPAVKEPEPAPGTEARPPQTPEEPGPEPEGEHLTGGKAISELIKVRKDRQTLTADNAYLKGQLDAVTRLVQGGQTSQPPNGQAQQPVQHLASPPRPNVGDFDRVELYEAAMSEWSDRMVDYRASQIAAAVTHKTAVDNVQQAFIRRLADAAKTNPTITDAFTEVGPVVSQPMADFIRLSPQGPQVLLYLHEHKEDTARLARSNPYLAVAELGHIAGRFAAASSAGTPPAQPIQPSKAPPPVKPVANNGAPVETPLDKLPIDDFMKERNEAQYGRRR